jgi:hypothetical protein
MLSRIEDANTHTTQRSFDLLSESRQYDNIGDPTR